MSSTEIPHAAEPAADAASAPRPWARGLFSLAFILLFALAETLLTVLAIVQFGWLLLYRTPNPQLRAFGASLGAWMAQVARFQAAQTEDKPFPWGDWPKSA